MHIHGTLLDEHLRAPHLVEQLRAAIHAFGVGHEKMQQAKLRRPQFDSSAVCRHAMRCRRQLQSTRRHGFVRHRRDMAAQHRADPRHQLARRERLGDVIIRTGFQPQYLVALIAARGQHDNRNVAGACIGAKLFRQDHTAGIRQHPVQQDQIRQIAAYLLPRAIRVFGAQCLKARLHHIKRQQLLDRRLIFHNQNLRVHHLSLIFKSHCLIWDCENMNKL